MYSCACCGGRVNDDSHVLKRKRGPTKLRGNTSITNAAAVLSNRPHEPSNLHAPGITHTIPAWLQQ